MVGLTSGAPPLLLLTAACGLFSYPTATASSTLLRHPNQESNEPLPHHHQQQPRDLKMGTKAAYWAGYDHDEDFNKCKSNERDVCCSQSEDKSWEDREEVCDLLGCNLKKCDKRNGDNSWSGDEHYSSGQDLNWLGDSHEVEEWSGDSHVSNDSWSGDEHSSSDDSSDEYHKNVLQEDSWDGDGHNKCMSMERDTCCSQPEHRTFSEKFRVCDELGCNFLKCGSKRSDDSWSGDDHDSLDEWRNSQNEQDTPVPTPYPTIDFVHSRKSSSWRTSYDRCDATATWRGSLSPSSILHPPQQQQQSATSDAKYSYGDKAIKKKRRAKPKGTRTSAGKNGRAAEGRQRQTKEWRGAAPTICPKAKDIMLEWNLVVLKANILDHNGPLSPQPSRRKLQYHYNGDGIVGYEGGGDPAVTQGPPASARAKAMIHLAIFEAFNCVTGKYQLYYADEEPIDCEGAAMEVAVAQAAAGVMNGVSGLSGLYGHNQTIMEFVDDALSTTLSREHDELAKARGIRVGREVAMRVLIDRYDDGYSPDNPYLLDVEYKSTGEPGQHRVDPLNRNQGYLSPGAAQMRPMGMSSEELKQFKAPAPPGLLVSEHGLELISDDPFYVASLKQVKALGAFRGGSTYDPIPTDDETYIIGNHWSANGSPKTGTPTTLYNDIARKIAIERENTLEENMLLFTILNMALGDTGTSTWDSKYFYKLWRPIVAIREHPGGGPLKDKTWKPLGASRSNPHPGEHNFSPPFPGHTSGHAAFGCAVFQTLANFYGTYDIHFTYTSPEWNGETRDQFNRQRPCIKRSYSSLIDVMAENAASRVFNGVHFDFEGAMGCEAGMDIANYIFENKFLPTGSYASKRTAITTDQIPSIISEKLSNAQTSGYHPDMCYSTPEYPFQ